MRVLILGCGPAGLFAAHAAKMAGADILIFSKNRKSHMFGAQYLHSAIPYVSPSEGFQIRYRLNGSSDQYRNKIYGSGYKGAVSPEELSENHEAWDIRSAYDLLWISYRRFVHDVDLDYQETAKLITWAKPDLTISTVPAFILCGNDSHAFTHQTIWSISGAPAEQISKPMNNTVVCNGEDSPRWYRAANVLGHVTVEWPEDSRPPIPNIFQVKKPLANNCDCLPDVVRMGRYGKWEKGVLSDSAYWETEKLVRNYPEQLKVPGL